MLYGDDDFGTVEFGFIPRKPDEDMDDEDLRYERHVRKIFKGKVRCVESYLTLEKADE